MTQIVGEHQPAIIITVALILISFLRFDRNDPQACPIRLRLGLRPTSPRNPLIPNTTSIRSLTCAEDASRALETTCADFVSSPGNSRQRRAKRLCPRVSQNARRTINKRIRRQVAFGIPNWEASIEDERRSCSVQLPSRPVR